MLPLNQAPKIITKPPGPNAKAILERDKNIISPSYTRSIPLVVKEAKGALVRDVDDNIYIDFTAGISVLNVGHAHPKIVEAIKKQAEKFTHFAGLDYYYENQVELAEKLVKITPGKFAKRVFYANSGAEASECAFKLARWHAHGKKPRMISFIGSFHGRTMGALSLTPQKTTHRKYFAPLVPGPTYVPYADCYHCKFKLTYPECDLWCLGFLEDVVLKTYCPPEEVAGIFVEPIVGGGGVIIPPPEYLPKLKKLCEKYGFLFIADEVQSGLCRSGKWFALDHWGVEPDIIYVAKSLASGLPLGAVISKAEIMEWEPGAHASTFGGNAIACASALATLQIMEENKLAERSTKIGSYMVKRLNEMKEEFEIIGDVRGKGMFIGVELVKDRKSRKPASEETNNIVFRAFEKGLIILTAGPNVLRIIPPLTIEQELVDKGLELLEETIKMT